MCIRCRTLFVERWVARFNAVVVVFGIAMAVIASIEAVCQAQDSWPGVRGPAFNGHSTDIDLLDAWPDDGPPVLWTRKLGQGYSAFVGEGDRVFTQSQNMTGQYLYCLKADTGETIWEHRYDWPYESAGVYPGPRSTPTLYHGCVYFTSPDGLLGCLNQSNGGLVWSVDLLVTYGIEGCDFGYACSPTLIDEMVILPVGGRDAGVVAFSAASGRELWRSTSEPASYTPAYPIEVYGKRLVVCYMQNCLLILNRETGKVLRTLDLSQGYDEHSAWPIYNEPLLWLSAPFRAGSYALDLSVLKDPAKELERAWTSKMMSNDVCSSVFVDGYVYGFDIFDVQSKTHRPSRGIFRCLEFSSGLESWSNGTGRPRRSSNEEDFVGDIGQCGIIAADGKLVVLNELGELILLKADPDECVELARCSVLGGELTWTAPCLHRGRVYVRNQSQAVCIYIGAGTDAAASVALRTSDLPQRQYYNLAAAILAVEPEYAFDIPHRRWLLVWYFTCLSGLLLSRLLVATQHRRVLIGDLHAAVMFGVAFVLGASGTTLLGRLTGEFVFTWPMCLYAALEFVASPERNRERASAKGLKVALKRRVPLFVFLIVCVIYFWICRRLSLVFEWAFLMGFVGALPVVWFARRFKKSATHKSIAQQIAITAIGFSAFYGATVLFLKWRY